MLWVRDPLHGPNNYRIYTKYSDTSTPYLTWFKIWASTIYYPLLCLKIAEWLANSVDFDETPRYLDQHCLLRPVCPNIYGIHGSLHFEQVLILEWKLGAVKWNLNRSIWIPGHFMTEAVVFVLFVLSWTLLTLAACWNKSGSKPCFYSSIMVTRYTATYFSFLFVFVCHSLLLLCQHCNHFQLYWCPLCYLNLSVFLLIYHWQYLNLRS